MKSITLFIASILIIGCQHAPTRYPSSEYQLKPLTKLEELNKIEKQHLLIVTHATTEFDQEKSAAAGIDQLVGDFKTKDLPVIYLVSDQSAQGYQRGIQLIDLLILKSSLKAENTIYRYQQMKSQLLADFLEAQIHLMDATP